MNNFLFWIIFAFYFIDVRQSKLNNAVSMHFISSNLLFSQDLFKFFFYKLWIREKKSIVNKILWSFTLQVNRPFERIIKFLHFEYVILLRSSFGIIDIFIKKEKIIVYFRWIFVAKHESGVIVITRRIWLWEIAVKTRKWC